MNRKLVFRLNGLLLQFISALLLLPMFVSIIYSESTSLYFAITAIISFSIGTLFRVVSKPENKVIYAKEGFLIVSLAWFFTSLIGSLPFYLSREIPSFVDAFFETVSGFTTTGASILKNVEELSKGLLFWRSFMNWIGGMGVLVFIIAFASNISDRSIHILKAEMPGPIIGKLMPRSKDTSKVLYFIYIFLTLLEMVLLLIGGMPLFDSIVNSFSTAGTGGFSILSQGIAPYSAYSQWVIGVFMILFGVNFNIYYLIILKKLKTALKSSELWTYFSIVVFSTVLITYNLCSYNIFPNLGETVRQAFFHVASIITTTGFSTADYATWPSLSQSIIFILLFTGACAGSTCGGFKISRIVIIFKMISCEIRKLVHPRSVAQVKFEGKELEKNVLNNVTAFYAIYMLCILSVFFMISFEDFGFETNFSAAVSCFNNVGPGFGGVGPSQNYSAYSPLSKLLLSLAMLMGRLEIYPILIAMIPTTWMKKR